jgi:gamma-glutamyl hercynylcysteine S-oxide synthase
MAEQLHPSHDDAQAGRHRRGPDEARAVDREDEVFATEIEREREAHRAPQLDDAVHVRAGPFVAGTLPGATADDVYRMDLSDNPLRVEQEDGFWIDRTAVSNARYAAFLEEVGSSSAFAHPDEPPGKDYTPAHWDDPRFNRPDHPVVGCDWYDAYAFAAWAGGQLPSETQWEKAARGADGRLYPWGNDWDGAHANYVGRVAGGEPCSMAELEELLFSYGCEPPAEPLMPVDALPEGASPYGLLQMSGNVWEMTRTNYFTRADMAPFFQRHQPFEFSHRPEAFYVIRGGTWTSPHVCLRTDFRGKDLLTDRHFEIGFRCVYEAPPPEAASS